MLGQDKKAEIFTVKVSLGCLSNPVTCVGQNDFCFRSLTRASIAMAATTAKFFKKYTFKKTFSIQKFVR